MFTGASSDPIAQARAQFLIALAVAVTVACPAVLADTGKLEGKVEETGVAPSTEAMPKPSEPMPVPVLPARQSGRAGASDRLKASAKKNSLQGQLEDSSMGQPGAGVIDSESGRLKGFATKDEPKLSGQISKDDPDADDQELMVEWDRWRNRFLHAIQSGMQENLNNPSEETVRWDTARRTMVSRFPIGTIAWFSCQVTPDRKVIHIKLLKTSGFPTYDKAVLDAIDGLQGSTILHYPRGSKRQIVTQVAGIKTAEQTEYRYFHFGDVERQRVPGGEQF